MLGSSWIVETPFHPSFEAALPYHFRHSKGDAAEAGYVARVAGIGIDVVTGDLVVGVGRTTAYHLSDVVECHAENDSVRRQTRGNDLACLDPNPDD